MFANTPKTKKIHDFMYFNRVLGLFMPVIWSVGAIPFTTASFSPYGPMAVHFTPYFMFPTHFKGVQPVPARHGQPDGPQMALPNFWIKDAGRNSLPGGVVEMPRSLICVGIRLFSILVNFTTYSLHPPNTQYTLIGGA